MDGPRELETLASIIKQRNAIDSQITEVIGRPAQQGHFGEFVAAKIFGIQLHGSATHKGSDGVFETGALQGKTVEIKYYPKRDVLDLKTSSPPDFYLAITGPRGEAESSRGKTRPWVIEAVYLFNEVDLRRRLTGKVKIGTATSIRQSIWEESEIYPNKNNIVLKLTQTQRDLLALFNSASVGS